jgi:hypothetical protein
LAQAQLASQRLIAASAELDPAERALLNLWVNRGFDDEAIARLIHSDPGAIATRRAVVVQSLSRILGLPPDQVAPALDELAQSARASRTTPIEERVAPAGAEEPEQPPKRRRRRGWLGLFALAIVAMIAIVVAAGGGGGHKQRVVDRPPAPPVAPQPKPVALAGLPGGTPGAGGTVAVLGARRLRVAVAGLPVRANGHYELWLYNSILDSEPLAGLTAPAGSAVVALPADFARYRWLDVSFQPAGVTEHSGESILRAAVPSLTS